MTDKVYNTLPNNCWFWCSVRIFHNYVKYNGIPKDLSNDMLKQVINGEKINIKEYDEETKKQADITKDLNGNAVELLTLNGCYYSNCFPIRNHKNGYIDLQYSRLPPLAFLLQYPGHYACILYESDEYILYDQTMDKLMKSKIYYDKMNKVMRIPVHRQYTNIYVYDIIEEDND